MISPDKIDEWIREVEERPSSGPLIVQFIANRLRDLSERHEALLAENIQLRTGQKVAELEAEIANLKYQLDLLKRQLGGERAAVETEVQPAAPAVETTCLFVYEGQGRVLRVDLEAGSLAGRQTVARIAPDEEAPVLFPRLLATAPQEELLFLFDSGRVAAVPAAEIPPAAGALAWEDAYWQEPRAGEQLATLVPVGRMAIAGAVVQFSRRGCVKRMMPKAFESYVANKFVGTGVKLKTDRTCDLVLCAETDRLVMASQEGFLLTLTPGQLSYAIEETIRLASTDHILHAFDLGEKPLVVFVTAGGKVIQREAGWLEPPGSLKTHGQPVFSSERRRAGARLAGAEAADESGWAAALDDRGELAVCSLAELFGAGVVFPGQPEREVLAFTTF